MGQFIFGLFIGLFIAALMRASAEAAEQVFINAGVECLFMFEGA